MGAMVSLAAEDNAGSSDFDGPLHCAAQAGDAEQARRLLQEGTACVHDCTGPFGYTALHIAAGYNSLGVVGTLLAARASANASLTDGERPLHLAAQQGHAAAIRMLILVRQIWLLPTRMVILHCM